MRVTRKQEVVRLDQGRRRLRSPRHYTPRWTVRSQYISGTRLGVFHANFQMQPRHRSLGEIHFSWEARYTSGVIHKHPKATLQLFRRHKYWEFYKGTKTLRIRSYGPLRYAIPKNVNFSNVNNRFRVIKSEVNFDAAFRNILTLWSWSALSDLPLVILSRYANVCSSRLSAITLSIILWKH